MPPKVVRGGGRGANRGRNVHRVRLADVGRPHRDPIMAPPPPEEVADQKLPEGGDKHDVTISHDVVSGAYPTAPQSPVPPIATVAPPLNTDFGAFVAQVVTTAVIAKPKYPWEVVDRARVWGLMTLRVLLMLMLQING
ncbi:hypothetical protein P3X46_004867 [Hevea brasiliensis]|uniref:Uncharacterized protein n=1 Tax=Hevea brasiliensis TaxID=3981 RepID=A0ABQ9MY16_HEVBR|nr:hypothetical protein P3X46_004867 [Hevea brasiliensis]